MEIPLRLVTRKDGSLFYGIPISFRIMMGGMLALIGGAIALEEFHTGPLGWIAVILLVLGFVYKEDWLFDASGKTISGLVGFYPVLKKTNLAFEEVAYIQLAAFSKGTVPGSPEEKSADREAFNEMRGDVSRSQMKGGFDIFQRKKLYIAMLIITKNEEHYLLDMVPARRASRLSIAGRALAALIGCSFLENLPE
ncbi:MAG: hypothetical protein ABFC85_09910 [Rectinema sp.]|jgi:hypothetical protein|uniref:Uncharacterized protein n=1 Tax=uncultured spirochete TaxID=156406 RepID=A0A3P3XQG3_9SPIR|nr:hypothetical protein SPIRO4BDMA_50043 [uncultured spirochete]